MAGMTSENLSARRLKARMLCKPPKGLTPAETNEAIRLAVLRRAASAKTKPENPK